MTLATAELTTKLKPKSKSQSKFKFSIGETIITQRNIMGIIVGRTKGRNADSKFYDVQIDKYFPRMYHESQIKKTKSKVYSKVEITEIKFDCLSEGTFCWRAIPFSRIRLTIKPPIIKNVKLPRKSD